MTRSRFIPVCLLLAAAVAAPTPLSAQNPMQLAGAWTLNRQLSQFPTDIGFSADFLGALGPIGGPVGGGGRRGGGGGGANRGGFNGPRVVRETEADSQRISTLTDEVRNPFDHLTIAVTPTDVTITPDRAPARMLHPDGRDDTVSLGRVTSDVTTTWDAGRLVVVYKAGPGRQLRYVYSLNDNPIQLIVDVEFVERGGGDKVRRVYGPTVASDTKAAPASAPVAATAASAAPAVPAAPATREIGPIDQRPDAALKGLTKLGLVLEDLSGDAVACGLKQDALETTISKHLSDAGFRVVRYSDDDTYLYVNINTAKVSTGLCVSRYDVTIYSHAAAKLPHTESPVLVQAELLHKGGIAGGAPDAHATGVTKGIIEYVDQFSTRIRNAGK